MGLLSDFKGLGKAVKRYSSDTVSEIKEMSGQVKDKIKNVEEQRIETLMVAVRSIIESDLKPPRNISKRQLKKHGVQTNFSGGERKCYLIRCAQNKFFIISFTMDFLLDITSKVEIAPITKADYPDAQLHRVISYQKIDLD